MMLNDRGKTRKKSERDDIIMIETDEDEDEFLASVKGYKPTKKVES
jgi:hypothetical protein